MQSKDEQPALPRCRPYPSTDLPFEADYFLPFGNTPVSRRQTASTWKHTRLSVGARHLVSCPRNSFNNSQRGNGENWVFMGPSGGGLTDPQPKFSRSMLDAPIMSIEAPCRPRTCRVFGSIIFWGCPVTAIQNMGPFDFAQDYEPFQRHGRYGCGLDDHLRTASRATDNFFKLFLGHDTRQNRTTLTLSDTRARSYAPVWGG